MRNFSIEAPLLKWLNFYIMGEAKRRKEQGLPPKSIKNEKKDDSPNIIQKLRRNQILPVLLVLGFLIFLIIDLVRYYNQ